MENAYFQAVFYVSVKKIFSKGLYLNTMINDDLIQNLNVNGQQMKNALQEEQ